MSNQIFSFTPVDYSIQECRFLLEHLGKPPVLALREVQAPVNPRAVAPIINRVYELEQLKEHEGETWVGVEALKEKIKVYLEQNAKWKRDAARSRRAPRYPSMFSFDSKGRANRGGVGSDSGRVHSYFDEKGQRQRFDIELIPDTLPEWQAPGFTEKPETGLSVNNELNRIECFCGHTESFREESRASYNAARARMSKHLRKATTMIDEHRDLHTREFGGGGDAR